MKYTLSNLKSFYCLLLTAYCLLLFAGCTASKPQIKKDGRGEKISIEKISILESGKDVLIEASGNITYTAFKLSEPARLILDIPGVDVEKVRKPMDINNEFITTITAASYGEQAAVPIARIEIGLKQGVVHEVKQGEGSIMVQLNHEAALQQEELAAVEATPVVPEQQPYQAAPMPAAEEPHAAAVAEAPPAAEKKEAKKADKLLRIDAKKENGATIIRIVGNGTIGDFNTFDIDKPAPPRLVVDVWNVGNSIAKTSVPVNTTQIKKVRIGEYTNKIRLVFDSNQKTLPPYTIERIEDSLVITAGKTGVKKQEAKQEGVKMAEPQTTAQTAAIAAVPEPAFAVKPAPLSEAKAEANAEVKEIDFKKMADRARLILTLSKKAEYKLSKSADETGLVLDIKSAVIADEFKKTLDASDLNTSVATISSFQSPANANDVRILIKLKEKADYDIKQQDGKIQVDFPFITTAEQAVPKKAEVKGQESKELKPAEEAAKKEQEPISTSDTGYTGSKISLDFKDGDISNIIRLMGEVSHLNIIAGEDVKGKVSLRLVDVPWDQAFDIILKTNGLGKRQEGNIIRIMPAEKIKKEREEEVAARKAMEKLEDLEIKLVPISYATAGALEAQVKGLLSDRGNITIEARTNTMVIKDIPANIKNAVDMIKKLDTPTPQVLIEARIIEAQSTFARDLGVQWGVAGATTSNNTGGGDRFMTGFGSSSTTPSSTLLPTGVVGSGGRFSAQPNYAVSLPAQGAAGPLGALGFSFGKLTGDPLLLDLRISAGEKNGLTKVVSRPRITTLNNKEAKISQGDSVPFETTSSSGTQTQFIDATLELVVTPHITPDGSISMKISAKRNSIGSFRSAAGAPSISKKEATTEIIVKNGETTVIGGIVVADNADTSSGIPWLKDIPILGWLFKNKSTTDSQTELLIFITPNIVDGKVEISQS